MDEEVYVVGGHEVGDVVGGAMVEDFAGIHLFDDVGKHRR